MKTANIERLLKSTASFCRTQHEVSKLKGELFNIFRILGIEGDEDGLHSKLIRELLDPKGSHGEGKRFLELFLQEVGIEEEKYQITAEGATVTREYYIGKVGEEEGNAVGGRIDIFVKDCNNRSLSVENKIWSQEGQDQVERYCNYNPDQNFVLFLTLEGDEAKTEKANHKSISYRKHIISWLQSCQRHCADRPIVRESIKQYIIILKELTGGTTMNETKKELYRLIEENIEASHEIAINYENFKSEKIKQLASEIEEKLKNEYSKHEIRLEKDNILVIIKEDWNLQGIQKKDSPEKWVPFQVRLGLKEGIYGIAGHRDDYDKREIEKKLGKNFLPKPKLGIWWPLYNELEGVNFKKVDTLKKLCDDGYRGELVQDIFDKLKKCVDHCNGELK